MKRVVIQLEMLEKRRGKEKKPDEENKKRGVIFEKKEGTAIPPSPFLLLLLAMVHGGHMQKGRIKEKESTFINDKICKVQRECHAVQRSRERK